MRKVPTQCERTLVTSNDAIIIIQDVMIHNNYYNYYIDIITYLYQL